MRVSEIAGTGDKSGVPFAAHWDAGQQAANTKACSLLSRNERQEGMAHPAQLLKGKWVKGLATDSPGRGSFPGTGEPICKTCTRGPGEAGEKSMRLESYHAENLMLQ